MAIQRFAPVLDLAFPFTADATIAARSFVVGAAADNHITNASLGASKVLGFCPNAIASGSVGTVVTAGIIEANASAAIARYTYVVVASAAGDVVTYDPDIHAASCIVGITTSTAAVALDTVSVLLMIDSAFPGIPLNSRMEFRARLASSAAVTLATGLVAGQSIDGVVLVAGDRVLLTAQATASQNGLYVATAAGAGTFAPEWNSANVKAGCIVGVSNEGTAWAGSEWKAMATQAVAGGGLTVGTTDPLFYPRIYKSTVAVGTPNTAAYVFSTTQAITLNDQTGANAVKAVLLAGRGTGTITLTGTGTDSVQTAVINW